MIEKLQVKIRQLKKIGNQKSKHENIEHELIEIN